MTPTARDASTPGPFAIQILHFPNLPDPSRQRRVPIKLHLPVPPQPPTTPPTRPRPVVPISHAAGARPALNWLLPSDGRTGLGPDLRDRRLVAAVALSPQGPGEPFFLRESFGSIAIPMLGISGTRDQLLVGISPEARRASFDLWPASGQHRFLWLAEANHFDFGDSTGSAARGIPSRTRADVQPIVRAAALAFFEQHLRGDSTAANRLSEAELRPCLRGQVDSVEVRVR